MFKKMMMFAAALASRGIENKKIDHPTKQLRVLSCFGFEDTDACPYLTLSKNKKNYYCGKCGCGDHKHTWLIKDLNEYSKLDYPKLECPLKMPGFSNYDPNFYTSETRQRKEKIEDYEPEKLNLIQVTLNETSKN